MNFAVIAAGEGTRLLADGVETPKPLVRLNGTALIDRLIAVFMRNGATAVSIIVNEENQATINHLRTIKLPVPLQVIVKTTPGSMYSLKELKPFLKDEPFCLSTVDSVFREEEFTAYITAFRAATRLDGLMAVTDFEDDEKPLYVKVNDDMQITGFYDGGCRGDACVASTTTNFVASTTTNFVSGGIYCLKPAIWPVLDETMATGLMRMRDFQRCMINSGLKLGAFPFSKIVDIDHAADIAIAEELIM